MTLLALLTNMSLGLRSVPLVHLGHHVLTMFHHVGMLLMLTLLMLTLLMISMLGMLGRSVLRMIDRSSRGRLGRCNRNGCEKDVHLITP